MRRAETALLHGPWPDATPTPDDAALTELEADFPGWVLWRAMSAQRTPGAWCARRSDLTRSPAGVTARSPEGLRAMLAEADCDLRP